MSGPVEVRFEAREALAAIEKVRRTGRDGLPLMRDCARIMHDGVEENFAKEGRPKWLQLAPSTIRNRRRRGTWPGKILQGRGRLVTSIQEKADSHNAIVGTNVVYARILHMGGTIRHGARERVLHFKGRKFAKPSKASHGMKAQGKAYTTRIPPRPFLQVQPSDLRRITETARRYLIGR